ncbi:MAG: rhomboid family intramembrane serine protease [Armatimonadetes bacterium]|jgi:membrane associated rhomboid family serine protease|nr:rhomboid family intramembrane serine protease [Armatimonadota bacterium]
MFPLRDNVPSRRYPLVTLALIVTNVAVFLHENSLGQEGLAFLFQQYGVVPVNFTGDWTALTASDALPLLTSVFLHGGWLHLISNLWYLWIFGDNVEDRMGHGRFLAFYLLGGAAASVVHVCLNPVSTVPSVGASGAIAAVLGAYLLLFPRARIITLVPIFLYLQFLELPASLVLGFWFITQLFSGVGSLAVQAVQSQGGVAYWAHIGGFVFGMLALPVFRERRRAHWWHDRRRPWPF